MKINYIIKIFHNFNMIIINNIDLNINVFLKYL